MPLLLALFVALPLHGGSSTDAASSTAPAEAPPGVAAPPELVRELDAARSQALQRFEARDVEGVLTHVSDQYRTGPFTKPLIRDNLLAIYGLYETVRARVQIDDVRLVGEHAWVYSTGEISGQLPLVGTWVRFLSWQRELEVARREAGRWRLFGYQQ